MFIRVTTALLTLIASLSHLDAFAAVGRTVGQFAVSPSGSAQYSIPLWTPLGIRGIQPHLGLTYDSQLSYGIMGPGWTMNGLSAISRCNRTYAQDAAPAPIALTMADAFCLDGNRLRLTSSETLSTYGQPGTTYQTEIANFSNVTANGTAGNGPSFFTVQGKDGLTYEYGNTTDSKVLPNGNTTPYIWALDKVTDRAGNHMTFTYLQAGGSFVPSSIQYTAPSGSTSFPYQVNFHYTTLVSPDPNISTRFIAGSQIQQTQQLSTITATSSGTTVREYKLSYTTSATTLRATLTSIQECGGSAGTDCLAATAVGYQGGTVSTVGVASPATASGSGSTNGTVYSVDIDGDGKQDLVFAVTSGSNFQWWVQLATATGYGAPINTGAVTSNGSRILLDDFDASGKTDLLAPKGGTWYVYRFVNGAFTSTPTVQVDTTARTFVSADVQGDGLPDIVSVNASGSMFIQTNTSSGGVLSFSAPVTASVTLPISGLNLYGNNDFIASPVKHMDFDGDGRDDLVVTVTTVNHQTGTISTSAYGLVSRGNTFVLGPGTILSGAVSPVPVLPVRWNEDSCTDLQVGGTVQIAACNGNYGQSIGLGTLVPTLALDWDGDGRTDLLANVSGTWQVIRSEGNAFAPAVPTSIRVGTGTWVVTDKDGDGLHDLVFADSTKSNAISFGLHNGAGAPPDLATSFNDGYGNSASPTYVSIVQSNYSQYSDATYPYRNYIGPFYVVSKALFSDPSNMPSGTYSQTFSYFGAWMNLQGRGFSGFEEVQRFDSRNALWEGFFNDVKFPWVGILDADDLTQDQARTKHVRFSWINRVATTLDSTAYNERYFPYINGSTIQSYELGGTENTNLVTTTNTNYIFDNYGNATNISTTVTDNDSTSPYSTDTWTSTTVNTITPNTSTWCLDLPTETTVTNSSSAPGGAAITRTIQYNNPDYANCRETQKVTEPNSATYKVTEDYGYDTTSGNFGNLHTVTVTGVAMPPRLTTTDWTANGQFPQTITNPLSQSVSLGFDPNTGMKTSQTDPNYTTTNQLKTTWTYDNFARELSELRPDGTSTTFSYNSCTTNGCVNSNNKMTVTKTAVNIGGSTLAVENIYLDSIDRTLVTSRTMLSGANDRNETQYDSLGRVHQQSAPCTFVNCAGYWTSYNYDALNRVIESERPVNVSSGQTVCNPTTVPPVSGCQGAAYSYQGRTTTVTDPQGKNTTKINLVTGALARTQDHTGYYINFKYDAFGSALSVTDSLSNTLNTMTYDYGVGAFQRTSSDADLGPRSSTYDALGELTAYSDAKGQNFSVLYDALSRPTNRTEPDLTTTWTWGNTAASFNIGKLQSVAAASPVGTYSEAYGYDSKTRPSTNTITIPSDTAYTYTRTYNATTGLLDTLQYPVSTSGYQLKLQYGYANGILQSIADFNAMTSVFWTANTINPRGQYTQEKLGNNVVVNHALDAVTGWVSNIQAGVNGGAALQNNSYLFDQVGNLTQRQDNNRGLTENIYYDNLYRLDHTALGSTTNETTTYGVTGNIATWSANGSTPNALDYTTPQSGCTYYANTQPHAVRKNTQGSSLETFCYDANGNLVAGSNSTCSSCSISNSWTSYNQPASISIFGDSSQFFYNSNHERYKQIATYSGSPETTIYVGGLMEKVTTPAGTAYRHYIPAGDNTALYIRWSTGTNPTYYITKDHFGSSSVVTDSTGALVVNESFTAWGWRRGSDWGSDGPTAADQTQIANTTRHGFTGQEMLENVGLVNLNGRIFGSGVFPRMISPDPYIPDPGNTQSFNRYSYVKNNPLTDIDPSGFFSLGDLLNPFSKVGRALALAPFATLAPFAPFAATDYEAFRFEKRQSDSLLRDYTWLQPFAEIAACYYGGPYACSGASAALTRLNGGSVDQALLAGALTFATSNIDFNTGNWATDALVKGVWAGDVAAIEGGSFWRGFEIGAAGSLAQSEYQYFTAGANPDFGPGQDVKPSAPEDCGTPGASCYFPENGHVPRDYWGINLFGSNQGGGNCFAQSQLCSSILDKVPGLQAVALLHDNWIVSGAWNWATMLPAAALTYSAFVGEYSVPLLNMRPH